ncbi:hypothetical protein [Pseudogulbenkiania ferrooxidans]|uniref:Tail fiber assembly protein n=1 Tax=Pseudogulbenkiania ferrooxidans EGD-HP2 TaxID=1388764 RepID=A0ABN0N828_9NEIS|nr:hypothetical protein [Pseudogulbenkiania ferrooxidans]ERE08076.1 hypothetical protein O166_05930 [Pseudogulbenkiania ferrooxidans EGD-HP2]
MTIFYSAGTGGFYDSEIHGQDYPADAVQVEASVYETLFRGQAAGKLIQADGNGCPVLVDGPALSIEQLRQSRMARCQGEIGRLEADQHRAVRELLTSMLGGAAPVDALKTEAGQRLQQVETAIVRLRSVLERIAKAQTSAELNEIA